MYADVNFIVYLGLIRDIFDRNSDTKISNGKFPWTSVLVVQWL